MRRLSLLLGSTAVAATLFLPAAGSAQEPCCAPAPAKSGLFNKPTVLYHPYYSPVIPVCKRWYKTDIHGNEYLVPYYCGYCRWKHKPPYVWPSCDCIAPVGPVVGGVAGYGVYAGARHNEETLLRLGGKGFSVPPGEPAPPDFIDSIRGGGHGPGGPGPLGPPLSAAPAEQTDGAGDKKDGDMPARKAGPPPATR